MKASTLATAAAALGAAALYNRHHAAQSRTEYPPAGRMLDVDGARVHVVERGSGPPIFWIHGLASLVGDALTSGVVERLAKRHRVILIDRPGYGHSTRPADRDWAPADQARLMAAVCRAIGVERPLVVGHSLGTQVAIEWAIHAPGQVAGLALLSGYYFPSFRPDVLLERVTGAPGIRPLLAWTILPWQGRLLSPLGHAQLFWPGKPPKAYLAGMPFGLMLQPGQLDASLADGRLLVETARRLEPHYAGLDMPMLIAWGTQDKLVGPSGQSERLATMLPHAHALPIEDGSHMVHHNAPDRIAAAIAQLSDAIEGAGTVGAEVSHAIADEPAFEEAL